MHEDCAGHGPERIERDYARTLPEPLSGVYLVHCTVERGEKYAVAEH